MYRKEETEAETFPEKATEIELSGEDLEEAGGNADGSVSVSEAEETSSADGSGNGGRGQKQNTASAINGSESLGALEGSEGFGASGAVGEGENGGLSNDRAFGFAGGSSNGGSFGGGMGGGGGAGSRF